MQQKIASSLITLTSVGSLLLTHDAVQARAPSPSPRVVVDTPAQAENRGPVAWDCVPGYWWGYWTWAWQPCAWLDREYVEHTIGAVANRSDSAEQTADQGPQASLPFH
jgi:hypothetical protein